MARESELDGLTGPFECAVRAAQVESHARECATRSGGLRNVASCCEQRRARRSPCAKRAIEPRVLRSGTSLYVPGAGSAGLGLIMTVVPARKPACPQSRGCPRSRPRFVARPSKPCHPVLSRRASHRGVASGTSFHTRVAISSPRQRVVAAATAWTPDGASPPRRPHEIVRLSTRPRGLDRRRPSSRSPNRPRRARDLVTPARLARAVRAS